MSHYYFLMSARKTTKSKVTYLIVQFMAIDSLFLKIVANPVVYFLD